METWIADESRIVYEESEEHGRRAVAIICESDYKDKGRKDRDEFTMRRTHQIAAVPTMIQTLEWLSQTSTSSDLRSCQGHIQNVRNLAQKALAVARGEK